MTSSLEKKLAVTSVFPSFYKDQAKSGNGTVRRCPFGDKSVIKT